MTDATPATGNFRDRLTAAIQAEAEAHQCMHQEGIDVAEIVEAVLAVRDDEMAALALLHEGEEPYEHEFTVATPAQWIWLWNRATPARRLEVAGDVMEACARSDRCSFAGHEERLEQVGAALGANIRALAIVDDWLQHRAMRPETRHALSEVRRALTGEEQPAMGGTISATRFRQIGEGPVCGTIPPLPRRTRMDVSLAAWLTNPDRRDPDAVPPEATAFLAGYRDALRTVPDTTGRDDRTTPDNPPTSTDTPDNDPYTGLVVGEYRHDHGHKAWVFRCWGDDTYDCDGWLSLDHTTEAAAIRSRDRHVAEKHVTPATPSDQEG